MTNVLQRVITSERNPPPNKTLFVLLIISVVQIFNERNITFKNVS